MPDGVGPRPQAGTRYFGKNGSANLPAPPPGEPKPLMTDDEEPKDAQRVHRTPAWLREPLLHFLLLGVLLFGLFQWLGGDSGPQSNRITVSPARVQQLASAFTKVWQRPPSEAELKGLVDDYVREEIAYREAIAMGLDRDDTIIRRRLRQKLEFLVEDAASATPPTEAELQAFLDAHPGEFSVEPQVSFRQVYVDPSIGGDAGARAQDLLRRLRDAGPDARIDEVGDSLMLDPEVPLLRQDGVARLFGAEFAAQVVTLQPGRWEGPVQSGYGLHLVMLRELVPGREATLDEVRRDVERELVGQRRRDQLAAMYDELLGKYSVTIERPSSQPPAEAPR
jgi:hypothetical protein